MNLELELLLPESLLVRNEKIATPATTTTAMIPNDRRLRNSLARFSA